MASLSESQKNRIRENEALANMGPVTSFPIKDPGQELNAAPQLPGDVLSSCCALLLAAVSDGQSRIGGLPASDEIRKMADVLKALGATIVEEEQFWLINGVGNGALLAPEDALDFEHAATAACLTTGLLSSYDFPVEITTKSSAPMSNLLDSIQKTGAQIDADGNDDLLIKMRGAPLCIPNTFGKPVQDERLKAALLLAGLNIAGTTTIIEPNPSSDHVEKLMAQFGAPIGVSPGENGSRRISGEGQADLLAQEVNIPGDTFLTGCLVVAGLIVVQASQTIKNVILSPGQTSFLETLVEMGADIEIVEHNMPAGQPVGDLLVNSSILHGVDISKERANAMGDLFPLIAVAASFANGKTSIAKPFAVTIDEANGMANLENALQANGVSCALDDNSLGVTGTGRAPGGGVVEAGVEARIAMACLIMGMGSVKPVEISDTRPINRDYPEFLAFMRSFGANLV